MAQILVFLTLFGLALCQSVPFSNTGAIPDPGSRLLTTTVAGGTPITDISLAVAGNHNQFMGDLHFTLISPLGTSVLAINSVCGASAETFDLILYDTAPNSISCPMVPETALPSNPFSAFLGEDPNGVWTLDAEDTFSGDGSGFVSSAALNVNPCDRTLMITSNDLYTGEVGWELRERFSPFTPVVSCSSPGTCGDIQTAPFTVAANVDYVFEATDSFGDGWNGAVLQILDVNQELVFGPYDLELPTIETIPLGYLSTNPVCVVGAASAGGDPHFIGFDDSHYDLVANSGSFVSVIADGDLSVNAEITTYEEFLPLVKSFMTALGFSTLAGDELVLRSGGLTSEASVTINGETILASEVGFSPVTGQSFSIRRIAAPELAPTDFSQDWHTVDTAFSIEFDQYTFYVYNIAAPWMQTLNYARFIDFNMVKHHNDRQLTGILGRTTRSKDAREAPELGNGDLYNVSHLLSR